MYSYHTSGVAVYFLGGKAHSCSFPLDLIQSSFPRLNIIYEKRSPKVEFKGDNDEALFNLAIQWRGCKNIEIDTSHYWSRSQRFDMIINLVIFARRYGLVGLGADMVKHLKPLILKQRSVLLGRHIREAEKLVSPHPIQELFAQAAVKSRLEFKVDPNHRDMNTSFSSSYSEDDAGMDEAHRAAYAGNNWVYESVSKTCPRFKEAVMDLAMEAWSKRDTKKGRVGKTNMLVTHVVDPLDGGQIIL